ncbi:MAG: alanine dehydrogenase [Acidimicrobiia bacterium]|nr:alanine dehydrogenase [Acidimicrobiia bacterium]
MRIGVPTEIKCDENRVGLTPSSIREIVAHGHDAIVQSGAGHGIGADDDDYRAAGASIASAPDEVFAEADLVVKVKEPLARERRLLRPGQGLFTYLHLAPDPEQAKDLLDSGAVCIAYETVTDHRGQLPLLAPMSTVAGRMAVQAGAHCLELPSGGGGLLIGGVPGVPPAKVVIIGGGVVGENATEIAVGMGADVTVLDRSQDVLDHLAARFAAAVTTVYSTPSVLEELVLDADLVIGAVLVKGARAPKLVTADMVSRMRAGSVLVDVAIDQGGCIETSHPTTHGDPTFMLDGVVHYAVANIPGAVPRTSTYALNNATLRFVLDLADKGLKQALADDPHLRDGLNVSQGEITEQAVADALGLAYVDPMVAIQHL